MMLFASPAIPFLGQRVKPCLILTGLKSCRISSATVQMFGLNFLRLFCWFLLSVFNTVPILSHLFSKKGCQVSHLPLVSHGLLSGIIRWIKIGWWDRSRGESGVRFKSSWAIYCQPVTAQEKKLYGYWSVTSSLRTT